MGEALSDLDVAWEQAVAARARDDAGGEARALSLLELALYQVGRGVEADEIGRQVVDLAEGCSGGREILLSRSETWMRLCTRLTEEADVSFPPGDIHLHDVVYHLKVASDAYSRALAALDMVAGAPEPLREEVRQRAEAVDRRLALRREELHRGEHGAHPSTALDLAGTVFAGFLAVKVLGPFLEEWAKKLGEQFGESTIRALGRIRFRRPKVEVRDGGLRIIVHGASELWVSVPGDPDSTVLVIPGHLSDAAKLAIIDLDPARAAVRGKTLYWHENDGVWLAKPDR